MLTASCEGFQKPCERMSRRAPLFVLAEHPFRVSPLIGCNDSSVTMLWKTSVRSEAVIYVTNFIMANGWEAIHTDICINAWSIEN